VIKTGTADKIGLLPMIVQASSVKVGFSVGQAYFFAADFRETLIPGIPMATILVLHGPNLNLLGQREPGIYGTTTLDDINQRLTDQCIAQGHHLLSLQSNAEYELIERIHDARQEGVNFIIFNPAAFTHTSVALRDALLAAAVPFIEVHLSNVHAREAFRRHSYFSDIAQGVICGLGPMGYELALQAALAKMDN
jgi:3-dehydroquinate dehydratase-2